MGDAVSFVIEKNRFMTSLKDLSREFVRNSVGATMAIMVIAIVYQQAIISKKDDDLAAMAEQMNQRERQMAIEKVNEVREQVEIYKNRLLEIEASLTKKRKQ